MKLPKQAKIVFKGKIFDAYQWKQKLYDGSTAIFEMLKRPNTIQVIVTQGDKIILAHESQPNQGVGYNFFGGRQEPKETKLQCAKRELLEESGLVAKNWKLLKVYSPHPKLEWEVCFFVAQDCIQKQKPQTEAGEKIKTIKIDFEKMVDWLISDKIHSPDFALEIAKMKLDGTLRKFKKRLFKK